MNDLTNWETRFDEMERNHGWLPEHRARMKDFIRAELEQAKLEGMKEGIKKAITTVDTSRTIKESLGIGLRESNARAQVIVDLFTTLNKMNPNEAYKCQSYYEEGKILDCTCGKCEVTTLDQLGGNQEVIMKTKLYTKKQLQTLDFVKDFTERNGVKPTLLDIQGHFRISQTAAWSRLNKALNVTSKCPFCGK